MKIAILSDTHGRNDTVRRAVAEVRARGLTMVIHCGDIEDPETITLFRGLTLHAVFGNCDACVDAVEKAVAQIGGVWHGAWGCMDVDGRRLAFLHGDDGQQMRELLATDSFDYLFHGHTHQARDELIGRTRVINPGALHRARPKTFVVLDLVTGEAESVAVD